MTDSSDEFQRGEFVGKILGELEALKAGQNHMHDCVDRITVSLDQFKIGIGLRIENHTTKLAELETKQKIMSGALWIVGASSVGALTAAFFKLIVKP